MAKVSGGEVQGLKVGAISCYKGIPFAAPPVGALRWKNPQPVTPWAGVKPATAFGPSPMQNGFMALTMGGPLNFSEDCLYLNVWTPATNAAPQLPVMVWFYGGAFSAGSTALPLYDGTPLAEQGVIVVSIAYRVGAFGFLAHPELTKAGGKGNFGIQDQIAGLQWVHANIGAFGGDPGQVTIFGQSAGAESVSLLVGSPKAKGLFHRAIAQSGALFSSARRTNDGGLLVPSLEVAEQTGVDLLSKLGAKDIAAARALPAEAILKAGPKGRPCYDDDLLPSDPYQFFQDGKANGTPILIGFNSDDGRLIGPGYGNASRFVDLVRNEAGEYADKILAVYPHATPEETRRSSKNIFRDMVFAWQAWCWANLQARRGTHPVFFYEFDHHPKKQLDGAGHGAELGYVFGNLKQPNPVDGELSERMIRYWVNFAKTGNPNGAGLPAWQPFTTANPRLMLFDGMQKMVPMPDLPRMEVLDAYFAWRRTVEASH